VIRRVSELAVVEDIGMVKVDSPETIEGYYEIRGDRGNQQDQNG
jgi:hypothetical protein